MSKFFKRKFLVPLLVFVVVDILAVGAGMGVPIFAILFGFVVGWMVPSILQSEVTDLHSLLRLCLTAAWMTSRFTFWLMVIIWGPSILMLLNPATDYSNYGIPMILYDPKVSFVGWLVLMLIISPFLQALTGTFGAMLRLALRLPSSFQAPANLAEQGS
jgi:hypothetical protein